MKEKETEKLDLESVSGSFLSPMEDEKILEIKVGSFSFRVKGYSEDNTVKILRLVVAITFGVLVIFFLLTIF